MITLLRKRKHTCGATSLLSRRSYLSGQQMRVWHYWVLGGSPYLISGPFCRLIPDGCNLSHFMDEWQRSWCQSAFSHMCTAQRVAPAILRATHLSGSWISAMVLWGDVLSVVHTFPPGGLKQVFWISDELRAKSAAELSRAAKVV